MAQSKNCKFCDKTGLRFLPLVYSVVVGGNKTALAKLPDIQSKKIGAKVTDLTLGETAKYGVRLMPPGYLYHLLERKGIKYWQAYLVLEDSFLYQLPNSEPAQVRPEFNCERTTCGINASLIDIPNAGEVKNAWLLYSPSAMTPGKLAEYKKNAAAYAAQGKMQHYSPAGWLGGNKAQAHTLQASELLSTVAEYVLFTQPGNPLGTPLGDLLEQQMIPATLDAYAGTPPDAKGQYGGRLGSLFNTMQREGFGAVVAYNPIGITQALNDFRNAPLESLQGYLAATDEYGASNMRRLQIHEAIEEIRIGFEQGIVQGVADDTELHKQGSDQYYEHQRNTARQLRAMGRTREAEIVEADIETSLKKRSANYQRALENAKREGATKWQKKYAVRLDTAELTHFENKLKERTQAAFDLAGKRASDHLKWFESERVLQAFDLYDPEDKSSGYSFALQSALCTVGMAGCEANQAKLDAWIKAPGIERQNLYMRGFMFNQADLIKSAQQEFADIQAAAGEVAVASAISAAHMQKITKGLTSGFKAIDSAFDEWVRNQGKEEFSREWIKPSRFGKWVGKATGNAALQTHGIEVLLYHKLSEVTRTVFRSGLGGGFDKAITARLSGLLYARLGNLAEKLAFDELMIKVPPEKLAEGYKKRDADRNREIAERKVDRKATKVAGQVEHSLADLVADARAKVEAKVKPTLKELDGSKSPPTNNYHQVRIGVLLGCIEMIGLGEKLHHNGLKLRDYDAKAWLEISGSICAVSGIVLDTYYAAAKSIREIMPYKAITPINQGADIVRGGLKVAAGVLGCAAGVSGAVLDYFKYEEEKNTMLSAIYLLRTLSGGVSSGLTLVIGYSYTESLLRHIDKRYVSRNVTHKAVEKGVEAAARLSARVRLLVWAARLNWAGLALTAAEIGYLAFKDDDLQNWCEMCTFRKDKQHRNWIGRTVTSDYIGDVQRELEELNKAAQVVGIPH